MNQSQEISQILQLNEPQVAAVLQLLAGDHTVPFIARYRKEATGNLDEVQILAIERESERWTTLQSRKVTVLASLKETENWTAEREKLLGGLKTLTDVEDFYLPFRPKRRTRASIAREAGYQPVADRILANQPPLSAWTEAMVQGGMDIVAEVLAETPQIRALLREGLALHGVLVAGKPRGHKGENPYAEHLEHRELLVKVPGYRLLGMLRGAAEEHLTLSVQLDNDRAVEKLLGVLGLRGPLQPTLRLAGEDCWKRLLHPSLENEALQTSRGKAEAEAIGVFTSNLRGLLLASPLGQKRLLALDPGMRTGTKAVVLSAQGQILTHDVLYALEPHRKTEESRHKIQEWLAKYHLEGIAIGNGTGGREMLDFVRGLNLGIPAYSVNESGASVYSASEVAREEFPDLDLTVRGAISIGRRLLDPLAELVKIDPKAIGVGQYQHDVDQKLLKKSLDDVVVGCVNQVGVDLNTATKPLLSYVAGFNGRLATAVVEHRRQKGPFRSRKELLAVKGLGAKTFEQAAGFLRINGGDSPLDASAVHPESYGVVEAIAKSLGTPVSGLLGRSGFREQIWERRKEWAVGEQTLRDILDELEKPGRDPRPAFEVVVFSDEIRTLDDLKEGQVLNGLVTNVTDFGAFVDIGVHQDGLIHISQLSDTFVRNPRDIVQVGQQVRVTVLGVDKPKKRISLSRKTL